VRSYCRHGVTVSLRGVMRVPTAWRQIRRSAYCALSYVPNDDTDRWSLSPGRVNERGQAMNVLADMMRAKGIRSELPLRNTGGEVRVRKVRHRGRFRLSVRTALSAVITLGACSALLTTGSVFVSASPRRRLRPPNSLLQPSHTGRPSPENPSRLLWS